jgi:hypothetical protein
MKPILTFSFVRRLLFNLLIILIINFVAASSNAQQLGYEGFNPNNIPIFQSRIFVVPDQTQSLAFSLIGDKSFVSLDSDTLSKLFPGQKLDTREMLQQQINRATSYAQQMRKKSEDPFSHDQSLWAKREALEHQKYADYSSKIGDGLSPYLIKAVAYYKTGAFSVSLKGDSLDVRHGDLGHFTPPKRDMPIVVFVERPIHRVVVSASIAE